MWKGMAYGGMPFLGTGCPVPTVANIYLTLYLLNFFRENINMYLHFMSFLHIDMTEVVEILHQVRQGPIYAT